MPSFVFFADAPEKRRGDGINAAVAQGADATTARSAAEALVGEPGAFARYAAVELTDASPAFVTQGTPPVGSMSQSVWPTLTRSGGPLRG